LSALSALDQVTASLLAASREFVEHGEVPRPALALIRRQSRVGAVFGRAGEDRHRVLGEMLLLAVASRADALVLVQDAWTSSPPARDAGEIVPPSEDPEAIEALVEVRGVRGDPLIMTVHPYSRDDRGRVRFREPAQFSGELAGVVPDLIQRALVARSSGLSAQVVARVLAQRGHQVVLEAVG
jgi:hypothetical protein